MVAKKRCKGSGFPHRKEWIDNIRWKCGKMALYSLLKALITQVGTGFLAFKGGKIHILEVPFSQKAQ
jgi:hypothetical protein